MTEQKIIAPLVSEELIHKVKELGNLSKTEKAKACGYYSVTKNGLERVNMKQFLHALIVAEGIELDNNDDAHEKDGSNDSYSVTVQPSKIMNPNQIIRVNLSNKPIAKPTPQPQPVYQPNRETEPAQQLEIEQPEQPVSVVQVESLAEPSREKSVCGSGWSIAELMNEFSWRSSD